MNQETYLYFGEDTLGVSATAACYPVSNFINAGPSAAGKIKLMFKSLAGTATDDMVELTFTTDHAHRNALEAITRVMANPNGYSRNNIVTVYDGVAGTSLNIDHFNGTAQSFTAVDITLG
tara:strand:+ start:132 stop:491 length:360 start_codon:yes stop_codon:yes gene_type:complete